MASESRPRRRGRNARRLSVGERTPAQPSPRQSARFGTLAAEARAAWTGSFGGAIGSTSDVWVPFQGTGP
eukprot:9594537-Alexandrium_andersonii.AAC.1